MSIHRILPDGNQFQLVETDGEAGTLTIRNFKTKAGAQLWTVNREPMEVTIIRWRDQMPLAKAHAT